jgi:hypothetical protein
MNHLDQFTDEQLASAILEVLPASRPRGPRGAPADEHELAGGVELARAVAGKLGVGSDTGATIWRHLGHAERRDSARLASAVWMLVARGLVVPYFGGDGITKVGLTAAGVRATMGGEPTPRNHRFTERLRERCPNPNSDQDLSDVHARVEDAVACLESHIPRAAVVMVGLALEVTTIRALVALIAAGLAQQPQHPNAMTRLNAVRVGVEAWPHATASGREERHALRIACGVAESIREQRNNAAHDAASTFEELAVEELVASAARQTIPAFWNVVIKP